jgi:methylenetetrahydrofolate dehydrogenase (NADP+)/methenyltetrahydrofolate cyclohydrolase
MPARIIDGKTIAAELRAAVATEVQRIVALGVVPGLAVVLVGENPASAVYVRNKSKQTVEAGMRSFDHKLPEDAPEREVLALVGKLNADPAVHGILVQLPLPKHIDSARVLESIAPAKDVDGFHEANLGALMAGRPGVVPCTPLGCMRLIEHAGVQIAGKHAVVVGRSNIVGKPVAMLLLQKDATVTICHSKTPDLEATVKRGDIVIAAVGRAKLVSAAMVKPGACVVDVGINRLPDGKLAGDVDYDAVKQVAGWITPVPGGVGPMTIAMLLENCLSAAAREKPAP